VLTTIKDLLTPWMAPGYAEAAARGAVILGVLILALIADLVTQRVLIRLVRLFVASTKTKWDDALVEQRVFHRIAHLAPAMVIDAGAGVMFPDQAGMYNLVRRVVLAYYVFVGALVIDALLTSVVEIYRDYEISKDRPIKSYIQVVKIVVYLLTAILILASLMQRSPLGLLTGLGALTAVIMLVFKDSILGFVASIQLTANDMVRLGDWIEMPEYGADGDVMDLSLTTVKVQNWDKTITTIPTYALIAKAFKNWRGMSESGGRRIKRAINIDMNSVKFCDEEMLARFRRIEYIAAYIERRQQEIEEYNRQREVDTSVVVNGRRMTNLGTFREYLIQYLRHHPKIHQEMTFLIRHLPPTESGLPVEIYVFSNDQEWANYEAIQADIFDHVLAVIPQFDLRVFQNPTGADFRALGSGAGS